MLFHKRLLLYNKAWVSNRLELHSAYFRHLSKGQKPQAIWIGCSDSRVPAEEITGARPGELFVHRNVANLVHAEDSSLEVVLHYALTVLQVPNIIVCGHTGCGGVQAAYEGNPDPILSKWLAPVRALKESLGDHSDVQSGCRALVHENVIRGVQELAKLSVVQDRWHSGKLLDLHGWIYNLESGILEDYVYSSGRESMKSVRRINHRSEPLSLSFIEGSGG